MYFTTNSEVEGKLCTPLTNRSHCLPTHMPKLMARGLLPQLPWLPYKIFHCLRVCHLCTHPQEFPSNRNYKCIHGFFVMPWCLLFMECLIMLSSAKEKYELVCQIIILIYVSINTTYFALQWMKSQSSSHTYYKSMEWRMSPKFTPWPPKYMKEGSTNHSPLSSNLVHIIIHWFQANNIFCHLLVIQNIHPFHGWNFRLFSIFFLKTYWSIPSEIKIIDFYLCLTWIN